MHAPQVIVVAGPNGAGKTTASKGVLRDMLPVVEFVNADAIAAGLSGYAPGAAAISAGRIMLARLRELAHARADFAFETTLASRTFAPFLRTLRGEGYEVNVLFLWLSNPAVAVRRVKSRVAEGGHSVPEDVVRRRYQRGLENFFALYRPLADRWRLYDNSGSGSPQAVASGTRDDVLCVQDARRWSRVLRSR
jgi:predicted ABC-type ATPase